MKVLDFYAPWCAPCKALEPTLLKKVNERGIELEKVNVESDRPKFDKYGVRTVPTLIIEGENGEVSRLSGMITPDKLDKFLSSVVLADRPQASV